MSADYTVSATARGGRAGHVRSDRGRLDLDLSVPEGLGGPGGEGTNPEELFAAGWAACFHGALSVAGGKRGLDLSEADVTCTVRLAGENLTLSARIEARVPGADADSAQRLAESAHRICPYSRATSGNIEVEVSGVPA